MSTAKDRIRSDGEPFLDSNDGTDRRARGLQNRQLCWPISVVIPKNCVRSSLGDSSIGSGMRGLTCHSVVSPSGMVETPRLQGSAVWCNVAPARSWTRLFWDRWCQAVSSGMIGTRAFTSTSISTRTGKSLMAVDLDSLTPEPLGWSSRGSGSV